MSWFIAGFCPNRRWVHVFVDAEPTLCHMAILFFLNKWRKIKVYYKFWTHLPHKNYSVLPLGQKTGASEFRTGGFGSIIRQNQISNVENGLCLSSNNCRGFFKKIIWCPWVITILSTNILKLRVRDVVFVVTK